MKLVNVLRDRCASFRIYATLAVTIVLYFPSTVAAQPELLPERADAESTQDWLPADLPELSSDTSLSTVIDDKDGPFTCLIAAEKREQCVRGCNQPIHTHRLICELDC